MADIILKKRSGAEVEHDGIRVLQVPKADGTKEDYIVPTGNINITDTQVTDVRGKATAQVVDANLKAENIAKDVSILGITGTHEGGGGEFPQLHAPAISISEDTLTITNPANNGDFVTGYKIYVDGELHSTVTATTVDLSGVTTTTASVTVKCSGNLFADSTESNAETLRAYYTITFYDGDTVLSSSSVGYGLTPTIPSTVKVGYAFDYWCSDSDLTTETTVGEVTGNTNYYGKWSEVTWASLIQSPPIIYSAAPLGVYYSESGNALAVNYTNGDYGYVDFYDTTTNPYTYKNSRQLVGLDKSSINLIWYTIPEGKNKGREILFVFGARTQEIYKSLRSFTKDGAEFGYVPNIQHSGNTITGVCINKTLKKLLLTKGSKTAYMVDLSNLDNGGTCTYEEISLPYSNTNSNFPQSFYMLDDGKILHVCHGSFRTYELVDGAYVENTTVKQTLSVPGYYRNYPFTTLTNDLTKFIIAYSNTRTDSKSNLFAYVYDITNANSYTLEKQIYHYFTAPAEAKTFGFTLSPDNHIVSGYGNPGVITVKDYETDAETQIINLSGPIFNATYGSAQRPSIAISKDCKKMTIIENTSPYLFCYSITPTTENNET